MKVYSINMVDSQGKDILASASERESNFLRYLNERGLDSKFGQLPAEIRGEVRSGVIGLLDLNSQGDRLKVRDHEFSAIEPQASLIISDQDGIINRYGDWLSAASSGFVELPRLSDHQERVDRAEQIEEAMSGFVKIFGRTQEEIQRLKGLLSGEKGLENFSQYTKSRDKSVVEMGETRANIKSLLTNVFDYSEKVPKLSTS